MDVKASKKEKNMLQINNVKLLHVNLCSQPYIHTVVIVVLLPEKQNKVYNFY